MTTFTLTGVTVRRDNNDNPISVTPASFVAVFPNDQAFITYSILNTFDPLPEVSIGGTEPISARLNGNVMNVNTEDYIGYLETAAGRHIILNFWDPATNTDNVFQIGGPVLTLPTTVAQWNTLEGQLTGEGIATGSFAPNQNILMSSLYNVDIDNTPSGPTVIPGTNGDDILVGTAGDDTIITGNATEYGDEVVGSGGNDTIDMSGNDGVNGYVTLNYSSLSGPIVATLNGITNTGSILKNGLGTDTLIGVAKPLNAGNFDGGLNVLGTTGNDSFTLTVAQDQWMSLRSTRGTDSYSINGPGDVRLDFRRAEGGLDIDLDARQINDDGFGNSETIGGTGNVWEVYGSAFNDSFVGSDSNESYRYYGGNNTIDGGGGFDRARYDTDSVANINVNMSAGTVSGQLVAGGTFSDTITNIERVIGAGGNDTFTSNVAGSQFQGRNGNDQINGNIGSDTLYGDDGSDTLTGGGGDDFLYGGSSNNDLRDVIFGGAGHDVIDGGYGNDSLRGDGGNDTITGGWGVDTIVGGEGNDILTGQVYSDLIFGQEGDDFINGGFGSDRVNGGSGADQFYHLGINDHGSDWIQDFSTAEGDRLVFGNANALLSNFVISRATTPTAGDDNVQEVFITYIPAGRVVWALVDGDLNTEINIQIGQQVFDLLA